MIMQIASHRDPQSTARRVLCAFTCTAVIGFGVVGFGVPMAQAHAERALRAAGHTLFSQLSPDLLEPAQTLSLNGERMLLASVVTSRDVSSVLTEFKQRCQPLLQSSSLDPDGTGHLACFASSPEGSSRSLLARAREFAQSGDLSRLGDALYVVAKPDTKPGFTHVISVWTEGKFDLAAMFSNSGDAPGTDPQMVPRPPNSVRIVSAKVVERPYALHLYTTQESSRDVLEFYVRELKKRGFYALEAQEGIASRGFTKDGAGVIVSTSSTASGRVCVSLVELGTPGYMGTHPKEAA